jgi:hypothetical protein
MPYRLIKLVSATTERDYDMPRRRCTFRETDVKRAVRAVRAAGVEIGRVEVGKDYRGSWQVW